MMSIVSTPPIIMLFVPSTVLTAPMVGCKWLSFYGLPLFIIKKGVVNDLDTPYCWLFILSNK